MIHLQKIDFPANCEVTRHEFYDYNPEDSFSTENNIRYLQEDLLACSFPDDNIIVDLGWYGDILSNKGEYKIQIIQGLNWEVPVQVVYSKSVEEIKILLEKTLHFFSSREIDDAEA